MEIHRAVLSQTGPAIPLSSQQVLIRLRFLSWLPIRVPTTARIHSSLITVRFNGGSVSQVVYKYWGFRKPSPLKPPLNLNNNRNKKRDLQVPGPVTKPKPPGYPQVSLHFSVTLATQHKLDHEFGDSASRFLLKPPLNSNNNRNTKRDLQVPRPVTKSKPPWIPSNLLTHPRNIANAIQFASKD